MWIDVYSADGTTKQGSGPITTAQGWSSTVRLDRAGSFSFQVPASDPQTALLTAKRVVKCYELQNNKVTLVGTGIIQTRRIAPGSGGSVLEIAGSDLLGMLTTRTVGDLALWVDSTVTPSAAYHLNTGVGQVNLPATVTVTSDDYLYVGNTSTFNAINITLGASKNNNASTWKMQYFTLTYETSGNPGGWVDLKVTADGTASGGAVLAQNGSITFEPPADWDTGQSYGSGDTNFYVRLQPSASLDATNISAVTVTSKIASTTALATVDDYFPSGWAWDTTYGYSSTQNTVYGQLAGESVMAALTRVAEWSGEHFRISSTDKKVCWLREPNLVRLNRIGASLVGAWVIGEIVYGATSAAAGTLVDVTAGIGAGYLCLKNVTGTFLAGEIVYGTDSENMAVGVTPVTDASGVRAVMATNPLAVEGSTTQCIITALEKEEDSWEIATRIYPHGGGTGSDRVTLALATRSAAAGYTFTAGSNELRCDTAETTYGRIDRGDVAWSEIVPQNKTDTQKIAAANQLYDAAYNWLKRHITYQESYSLQVAGLNTAVWPGQTIRVIYHEWRDGYHAVNIDADLRILEAVHTLTRDGLHTTALVVSTVDAWPEDDAAYIVGGIDASRVATATTQPNLGVTKSGGGVVANVVIDNGLVRGVSTVALGTNAANWSGAASTITELVVVDGHITKITT